MIRKDINVRCMSSFSNDEDTGNRKKSLIHHLLHEFNEESSFDEQDLLQSKDTTKKAPSSSSLSDLFDESNDDFSFSDSDSTTSNNFGEDSLFSNLDEGSLFGDKVDATKSKSKPTKSKSKPTKSKSKATSDTSKAKRKKQKRPKRKIPLPPPNPNILPTASSPQRRINAEKVFNLMAPHLPEEAIVGLLDKIHEFTRALEKELDAFEEKDKPTKKRKRFNALIARIDAFFTKWKKKKRGGITSLEKQVWVRSILTQFYGGDVQDHEHTIPMSINLDLENDKTYPPYKNQSQKERSITLLKNAREMSMKSHLFWSKNKKERTQDRDVSADFVNEEYFDTVKKKHVSKSSDLINKEAENLADHLALNLPSKSHESLLLILSEFALAVKSGNTSEIESSSCQENVTDKDEQFDSKSLSFDAISKRSVPMQTLYKDCGIHLHLISEEIAEFFYSNESDYFLCLEGLNDKATESRNEWDSIKNEVEESLLKSQTIYCQFHQRLTKEVEEEMNVERIMKEAALQNHENGNVEAFAERERNIPPQNTRTLKFECLMMNDRFGPYIRQGGDLNDPNATVLCSDLVKELPKTDRLLMIDNLPIDVSDEEILGLYSRCGPIDSVKIFNLKPDLDPGELTQKQIIAKKRKNRMSGIKGATAKGRKRTPVYALIQFQDEQGCKAATIDVLRIFGMTIRRHPVRSIPVSKLNELYVESNSKKFKGSEMMHRLSETLSPDIQVIPEYGQRMHGGANRCKIQFPTFEVAHYAFHRLEKMGLDNEDVAVNWIETPADAVKYWTRDVFIH